MKKIKYQMVGYAEVFNEVTEEIEKKERFVQVIADYSEEAEEQAKENAYNGEYTIEDDGVEEEPTAQDDTDAMLIDHEYRLTLLELGISESEV